MRNLTKEAVEELANAIDFDKSFDELTAEEQTNILTLGKFPYISGNRDKVISFYEEIQQVVDQKGVGRLSAYLNHTYDPKTINNIK